MSNDTTDHTSGMGRRDILKALPVGLATIMMSGSAAAETQSNAVTKGYRPVPHLYGEASNRPDPSELDAEHYAYIYEDPTGTRSAITSTNPNWRYLNAPNQTTITAASDFPDPNTSGIITLDPDTLYRIGGTVDIQDAGADTIDVNGATLMGGHGGTDTLLTTGTSPLLRTRGTNAFISRLALSAPAGSIFDLDAQDDTASLENKQMFLLDTSVVTQTPDIGTIRGYRAQSIKGCAFDTFDAGLTHDGSTQKVLYDGVFVINPSDTTSCITFADATTFSTDVVDIAGCYFLGLNDTNTVLDVVNGPSSGGTNPVQVSADYVRNFHDDQISPNNILSGITTQSLRWEFQASAPLSDSIVSGNMRLNQTNAPYTTTISTVDTWTKLNATTISDTSSRIEQTANNELTYRQTTRELTSVDVKASLSAATTTIGVAIGINGSVLDQSQMLYETKGNGSPVAAPCTLNQELQSGDTISVYVKNVGATGSITAHAMNVLARAP